MELNKYFDCAATRPLNAGAQEALLSNVDLFFANASSSHSFGRDASERLEDARAVIAKCINAQPDEIFFTSGGTEANNWVMKRVMPHAAISAIEHHSVSHPVIPNHVAVVWPNKNGIIETMMKNSNIPVAHHASVMLVNNETGVIQPIKKLAEEIHSGGGFFHTDAVQAVGHIPVDVKDLDVDFLSMSAHKFGGPTGIGALYIKKSAQPFVKPLMLGGQQEHGFRPGSSNVLGAIAMARALEDQITSMRFTLGRANGLRDAILSELMGSSFDSPAVHLHGFFDCSDHCQMANIINIGFDGVDGESLMLFLDSEGYAVSTGSACNSQSLAPSHVLTAMGVSDEEAHGAIRISFDPDLHSVADIRWLCAAIKRGVKFLRSIR